MWEFHRLPIGPKDPAVAEGIYTIRNLGTGTYIDLSSDKDGSLLAYPETNSDGQKVYTHDFLGLFHPFSDIIFTIVENQAMQ
jgi:hypothetical protein